MAGDPQSQPPEPVRPGSSDHGSSSIVRLLPPGNSGEFLAINPADNEPTIIGQKNPAGVSLSIGPGFKLGQYEIIDALGAGGMAAVLKARDTDLGRIVALKILPPLATRDPDAVTRFKQEARAAARLDHDHIARVFSCGEDRGLHFIAFEYVEGVTLRAMIDTMGKVPVVDCVRYMIHLATGLQHAWDRGIVHRDVKPSNIMITPDGRAKLIDMGLARQNEMQPANGGVTQSGITLGTFDYISPEQALDPRRADVRSDIYSLGCAFYHALTGRPPVPEGTAAKKLHAHHHEPPIDPREYNETIPDELAVVLSRMMMKDPAKRYQSPMEMIADLSVVADKLKIAEQMLTSSTSVHKYRSPLLRDPPRMPVGLLVGIAAVVVAVVVLVTSAGGNRTRQNAGNEPTTSPNRNLDTPVTKPGNLTPTRSGPVENTLALLKELENETAVIALMPGQTYDIANSCGVLFSGRTLKLECSDPLKPAVLRIAAGSFATKPTEIREGTFVITRADQLRIQGVHVEIVEKIGDEEVRQPAVGITIYDVNNIDISESRFELDPTASSAFGSGIRIVTQSNAPAANVQFRHCMFDLRRWSGLEFVGPTTVAFTETGFATAAAAIKLSDDETASITPIALNFKHCSFLLDNRAVGIDVRKGAGGSINTSFCVFGSTVTDATAMMTENIHPAAVRIAEGAETLTFTMDPKAPTAFYRVDQPAIADEKGIELTSSPWMHPNPSLKLNTRQPWKAFELNPNVHGVRVAIPKDVHLLGVRRLPISVRSPEDNLYDNWPPGGSALDVAAPGTKVWWADANADQKARLPANGIFSSLPEALAALKRDDVLLIRGNGTFEVPVLPPFARPDLRLTIRPESDKSHIALTMAASTRADTSMFRLEDGEVTFERLEFRLKPKAEDATEMRSQAVVSIAGGRRCEFHACTITMEEQREEKLAAVAVWDVSEQMRKSAINRKPHIRFENCLVRGKGRLIWSPTTSPFELNLSGSATVLVGSVFDFDPPTKTPNVNASIFIGIHNHTAILGGPLLDLQMARNSEDKAHIAVEFHVDSSLFAPMDEEKPSAIFKLQGGDPTAVERPFAWHANNPNGYANWPEKTVIYEHAEDTGVIEVKKLELADWLKDAKEKPPLSGQVRWPTPWNAEEAAKVKPSDLQSTGSWAADLGAKVKQLPKPLDE